MKRMFPRTSTGGFWWRKKDRKKGVIKMADKEIRLLRADEIECRVGTIGEKGLSLLLYKDARADMKVLDETFGCMGWQRSHQLIDGNLYCTVEIWDDEKKQWIRKQDVGTTSYTEKEKGQASDSFKRACVSVGIGRELYTAPFIWIPAGKTVIQKKGERFAVYDRFAVQAISYNQNREICALIIINQKGEAVYSMRKQNTEAELMISPAQIQNLEKELARTGYSMNAVLSRYRLQEISQMTAGACEALMDSLRKTRSKNAA